MEYCLAWYSCIKLATLWLLMRWQWRWCLILISFDIQITKSQERHGVRVRADSAQFVWFRTISLSRMSLLKYMPEDKRMYNILDVLSPPLEMPGEGRVGVSKVIDIIDSSALQPTIANCQCWPPPAHSTILTCICQLPIQSPICIHVRF